MKKLVVPRCLEGVEDELFFADAFLFGVKDLSVQFENTYPIEKLKEVSSFLHQHGKKIFVSCNKNYDKNDLKKLDDCLKEIEACFIDGVLFYDLAVLELVKTKYPNILLVWNQEHMTTNYFSAQFYKEQGVKGISISTNLTLEEIETLKKQTTMFCITPIFGYYPMFESKRHLVTNYLDTFSLNTDCGHYKIEKEGKKYPIVEHKNGTTVYTSVPLNGISEIKRLVNMNMDYCMLNERFFHHNLFVQVLKAYDSYLKYEDDAEITKLNQLLEGKYDLGFLYKKTVYRVKKNG